MNRRIPVKKNYLAFLPALPDSRMVRNGLFLIAGFVVILLCWLVFSNIEMEAATVFGVLALFSIPIIVLTTVFFGLKKITGMSCLLGLEWVGKNTLLFVDWIVNNVKNWLGIELKKSSPVMQAHEQQERFHQPIEPLVEPTILPTQKIEPELVDFTPQQKPEAVTSDIQVMEVPEDEQQAQILTEIPVLADATLTPDSAAPHREENQPIILPAVAINPVGNIKESTEERSFNNTALELPDTSEDIIKDERATVVSPPVATDTKNDLEISTQSNFQQHDNEEENAIIPELENSVQKEESLFTETSAIQKEPENQLNSSFKTLIEEAENKVLNVERFVDNSEYISHTPATEKQENKQTISPIENHNTEIEEPMPSSLRTQAEQTAASILASISQKFSSTSEQFSRSFSDQNKVEYQLPAIDLLQSHQQSIAGYSAAELDEMSRTVERVLKDYKVIAEVVGADPGPIITRFELLLAPGVKVSRVSGLAKDLARAMLVTSVRVVEIIEGTPFIGLEIPNNERELVSFREIIASDTFQQAISPISFALGKDVSGQTVVSDLAKMPHLLVAGTTGSGKSVAINTMIISMLYKATPEQVRMIMVDPKMLELSIYEGIPHLLTPVVTDMKEAQSALRWAVAEMERRYKLMSKVGVRNLAGFNQKIEDAAARGETIRDPLFQLIDPLEDGETFPFLSTLPSIVIVIDELADMMMIVGKKVEELIARLAQKARAAGIHLVLATQRPSVDVLTGLIKANVPTRISFQVSSRIDSRTILDQGGAEALLGNGDMLFLPSGTNVPIRAHGAFVSDDEVHAVVNYLKTQGGADYLTGITQEEATEPAANSESMQDEVDALYNDVVSFVLETGKASISSVQRRFKVGYNRAARMIDQMEEENIVSEPEGNGSRRVLNREE